MIKSMKDYISGKYRRLRFLQLQLKCINYRIFSRNVVFDVGANTGSSFVDLVRHLPRAQFYAFEPTPELASAISKRFSKYPNYHLTQAAVGEINGKLKFHVADKGDGGCSSLLEFSDKRDLYWKGRDDLEVTRVIEVPVIRLDTFIESKRIDRIDFLHIDTQGTDLAVLRSLGALISIVRGGVIEVPINQDVMLYKGQHSREEAVDFLTRNGFRIQWSELQQNEENLYFFRK